MIDCHQSGYCLIFSSSFKVTPLDQRIQEQWAPSVDPVALSSVERVILPQAYAMSALDRLSLPTVSCRIWEGHI
jgi:hypothetical protein